MIEQKFANLATLCKFDFCETEQVKFTEDLNGIVEFVGKVKEFDGQYDDTADNNQVNFDDLREDVAVVTATPEQLLANCNTQSDNNCYIIPRVID